MSKIILKKSAVTGKQPVVADLDYGELALNYTDGALYFKKSNNTIGAIGGGALQNRYSYTTTSTQTTFAANYTAPYVDVYLNGSRLSPVTDYTATNGTQIVLTDAAATNDVVEIVAQVASTTVLVDNTKLPLAGGILTGNVTFAGSQTFPGTQTTLVSGTSIKTINGTSVLGSGNIEIDVGVTSFNTRTGAVVLGSSDVTTALGFTPVAQSAIDASINALVDAAPGTLNTLNELAAALGDDPNFATTVTSSIAAKLPLSGGTMTGAISFATGQTWPTFNQSTTGSAATLTTARLINGVSFNGSTDITVADATKLPLAGGTMTGAISFAGAQTWPTFNQSTTGSAATATTATNQSGGTVNATTGAFSGNVTVTGTGRAQIRPSGDIQAYRSGGTTGVVYLNSAETRYLFFDGTSYQLNGAAVVATNITAAGNVTGSSASCTGNAATATNVAWSGITSRPSNIMFYEGFTLNADTMTSNSTGFTYASGAPYTGPVARFSTGGGYDLWLNATYSGGNELAFRTRNGDTATLNPWRTILHTGNYTSYAPSLTGSGASGTWGINITGNAATATNATNINSTQGLLGYAGSGLNIDTGGQGGPQVQSQGGGAAMISLHRVGAYAINFGLGTDNQLRTGGWSRGGNYVVLDSGNYTSYAPARVSAARPGVTKLYRSDDDSGYNIQTHWSPDISGYWSLRGYLNDSYHAPCYVALSGKSNRANGFFYIDDNFGVGVVGNYNASRYQTVYAMGDAYRMSADGASLANMYGMAWSHPNAGGAAGNLTDHGMLIINNGGFRCAISNSIVASGNITAYSDERLKTNWRDMPENFVARLAQVKVGVYDRLDEENGTQVGVSAQSFQQLLPQAIMTAKDEMQTLSVSYGNAALASAVELAKDNVDLRARITRLESLIEQLLHKE